MSIDVGYRLGDRYRRDAERAYLGGIHALVRLVLMQRWRDADEGLRTAGFVSGYRGSPLGTLDSALWDAQDLLAATDVRFTPGLNEDLAATAVWGSQQAGLLDGPRYDGVFGLWYGKGPGVDRSCDALKHANHAGVDPRGGVLALAGDDHGAKSSTIAHQSEHAFIHCGIPVLYPADVQEYLDFGLLGWAMSRFSGAWVGMKCVTDIVETAQSVDISLDRVRITRPDDGFAPDRWIGYPMSGLGVEHLAMTDRLAAVQAFARANGIDRVSFGAQAPSIGIVTAGKAHGDVLAALRRLGIDEDEARSLGLAVYKVGLTWPLEPVGLRSFARGLTRMLVVEEKRPLLQEQVASILYGLDDRPRLAGKTDEQGHPLLPVDGELQPAVVAEAVARWLGRPSAPSPSAVLTLEPSAPVRKPAFCAGCPHNSSTVVPEGSVAHGGIGCHGMATWLPGRRTLAYTHMGGEGANWIGHAPFTTVPHIFQNLGDGTYTHSGSLAIRAAVAAGVNITYKVLVNGAVAMTGGQPLEGHAALDEAGIVRAVVGQVCAEGAARVVVVADDPGRHRGLGPSGVVSVTHRDRLDEVQRSLREVPGVTVLVYDQACAAEARRLRKRGRYPDPDHRVVINTEVCEGCGDCSVQSGCIAIEPVETPLGRKRQINQDACNKDLSCLRGYCPSFAVVENATLRRAAASSSALALEQTAAELPEPVPAGPEDGISILVTGIGGTGVVTVGALLGMAAHLEGRRCSVLDVTGLAQKNGPVASHVRIGGNATRLDSPRICDGEADVVIGCDIVVTSSREHLAAMAPNRTVALVNSAVVPTSDFAADPDLDLSTHGMEVGLRRRVRPDALSLIDATRVCRTLLGADVMTNVFLVGMALQRGLLPVSREAIERAIELNAASVELNKRALALGRLAAERWDLVEAAAGRPSRGGPAEVTLDEVVEQRADLVRRHGGRRPEARYRALVDRTAETEVSVGGERGPLTRAVAESFARLLTFKDEFEVARLWTDGAFAAHLDDLFEPGYTVKLNLAPQRGFRPDPLSGRVRKRTFGPWMFPLLRVMARARRLRGTPLDVFGHTDHRRAERALIDEYESVVVELLDGLIAGEVPLAVDIAAVPQAIKGFGVVKEVSWSKAADSQQEMLAELRRSRTRGLAANVTPRSRP